MAATRSSDVRGEILDAATRLFAAHGFDGASLKDIADAVGIKKPSLLYHFPSKEALRQQVIDDMMARWNETLPKVLLAATAGEDQFDGITREIVSFFEADPDRARLLLREALDRPSDMLERLRRHVQPIVVNLAGYVRRGQRQGVLQAGVDPEAYLFQVVVLLVGGVAFNDTFGSLMPELSSRGTPGARLNRELLRLAKSSLFRGEKPEDPSKKPARRKQARAQPEER